MEENLLVNYVTYNGNFEGEEGDLIRKYLPLINLDKNPARMHEITEVRNECIRVAQGK